MLEFLSIDIGTIIFTLCNLLILYLIFKHFLFGRVHKILDERQNDVAEKYNKACLLYTSIGIYKPALKHICVLFIFKFIGRKDAVGKISKLFKGFNIPYTLKL